MHSSHELTLKSPSVSLNVPRGQGVGTTEPVGQYDPLGHVSPSVRPLSGQ